MAQEENTPAGTGQGSTESNPLDFLANHFSTWKAPAKDTADPWATRKAETPPQESKPTENFDPFAKPKSEEPPPPNSEAPQAGELKLIEIPEGGDIAPPSPDQYILPGEETADKGLAQWYRDTAFKLGLTKRQTAHLMQIHSQKLAERTAEAQRQSAITFRGVEDTLKTAWGTSFEANNKAVREFTAKMDDKSFTSLVQQLLYAEAKRRGL